MGRWPPTSARMNTRKGTPTMGLARLMTQLRQQREDRRVGSTSAAVAGPAAQSALAQQCLAHNGQQRCGGCDSCGSVEAMAAALWQLAACDPPRDQKLAGLHAARVAVSFSAPPGEDGRRSDEEVVVEQVGLVLLHLHRRKGKGRSETKESSPPTTKLPQNRGLA